MKQFSLSEKIKYKFDNLMSRGTPALIGYLAFISFVIVLFISFIAWLTDASPEESFLNLVWLSFMRAIDAGTLGGDTGSYLFMFLMLLITLSGIFIVSILIGLLTSGIQDKIESLRRGRSIVIESNHSIILWWSDNIFTLVSEIIEANKSLKKSTIVIMAPKDKVEMEEELQERIPSTFGTKIVCRQGSPLDIADINMLNISAARTVIINDDVDANTIKTILAITANTNQQQKSAHIVAVVKDPQNLEVTRIAGKGQAEIILADKLISRVIAQTCRQSGLSVIYTDLLDFNGNEIYFKSEKSLTGKAFGDIINAYASSSVIGLFRNQAVIINPSKDLILEDNDKIIVISLDDDQIILSGLKEYPVQKELLAAVAVATPLPETTLFLGWNEHAIDIIRELDKYVAQGSIIKVAAEFDGDDNRLQSLCEGQLSNCTVQFVETDISNRGALEALVAEKFDHIIVLCYQDRLSVQEADAVTLITLLHLRDISEKTGIQFSLVSEMLDVRNRELADVNKVNDFVISGKIISLMVAQISENKYLNLVYEQLFGSEGSEIYMKKISNYITLSGEVNFYTLVESVQLKNEIAIGYKIEAEAANASKNYGIYMNPQKAAFIKFTDQDKMIVIGEE
ncbi:CASTOR/POLLUX-related putative ion channel [Paenibacillus agricola]|uniref:Potassium transporter TrkA n=1 Tax=Paenibacillus agricola TaxID=2716264 RepID=A0ABX0J8U8_9BACL|nr:potassium transporter TrkA [Paenibacillus agricola]NHN30431.1 potassium transporter TrkA [Paenibacillus agricola]